MRKHDARSLDHKRLEAMRERAVGRVQDGESPWCGPDHDIQMAGAIPAWPLGRPESQAGSWTSPETRWPGIAVGLQDGDPEEPLATEVRGCAVDTRAGGEADQG